MTVPEALRYSTTVLSVHEDGRRNVKLHVLEHPFGKIQWEVRTGTCDLIAVDPAHRRQGIATYLWKMADAIRPIKHAAYRTDDGDAFARAIGGHLPPRERA